MLIVYNFLQMSLQLLELKVKKKKCQLLVILNLEFFIRAIFKDSSEL